MGGGGADAVADGRASSDGTATKPTGMQPFCGAEFYLWRDQA